MHTGRVDHDAEWWDVRMARNPSGAIYTCPLCDGPVHSATEHMLVTPEGNSERRRHAHMDCVREAISTDRLTVRTQPEDQRPKWFRRARRRWRSNDG
jgi:hypothetical protein